MTSTQSLRLAQIRSQMEKWLVLRSGDAEGWDVVFLLRILDLKNEQIRELKKGR